MRSLDFSSVHALITTLLSLAVITLIGVGIRLLTMVTIQQRRERMNRQINERLRTLIAAYKVLGGSFTGDLTVNPIHLRAISNAPSGVNIISPVFRWPAFPTGASRNRHRFAAAAAHRRIASA